jgi:UDP-N-acetyl-2-amino-2-deoxyglucuronate dehydrogenase
MNSKSAIRFAIIGCGKIGERHALHINEQAVLAACCDIDISKAKNMASEYGSLSFSSLQLLLESDTLFDVAVVCTPNGLHAGQTITCLEQNKHVVCEKPMALSVSECLGMIAAAENSSKQLFVVKQNRYNPPIVELKKLLEQRSLGKINSVQLNCFWNRTASYYKEDVWRGTKSMDGGTLFTQFSHFVDLLLWLMDDVVVDIKSMTDNFQHKGMIEFEDTGVVILRFAGGAIGSVHFTINSYHKNMEGSITIFGENGTVKIGGEYLNKIAYQEIEGVAIADLQCRASNDYGAYHGSMSNHGLFYENVIDVLEHGGTKTTNAEEAMKTVDLIERIYASVHES